MKDRHTARGAYLRAAAGSPFEHHHNGLGESTRGHRSSNSLHEHPGCPGSITPPPRRPRPDHIRCIDEEHDPSFTDSGGVSSLQAIGKGRGDRSGGIVRMCGAGFGTFAPWPTRPARAAIGVQWWQVQATSRRRPSSAASRSTRSRLRSVHRPDARSSRSVCTARRSASGPTLVQTDTPRRT